MAFRRRTSGHRKNNSRKYKNRIDNTKNTLYNTKYSKQRKLNLMEVDLMKNFKQELFELLTIQAPSGKEEKVVKWLKPRLEKITDRVFQDTYGNLLAEKVVGDGKGATVVLSAHMDTVSNIQRGRKVLFDEATQTFTSTKGVLGADDRAGIAIILTVLRNIDKTEFNGKIKVCFSREEEIGCVGSEYIPVEFYKDANLAIVVDRRGHRDIVTGCGQMYGFCTEAVGEFFENVSALLDMDWKAVPGGVSDAFTFSGNGVNSVNLSAGYNNEHTEKEYVNITHSRDTINLILQALSVINSQYHKFGEVPETKKWGSYSYSYGGYSASRFDRWDEEDMKDEYAHNGEVTFYDDVDSFGDVSGSTVAGFVSLYQVDPKGDKSKSQEVFMCEKNFRKLIDQYCLITGYKVGSQLKSDSEEARWEREWNDSMSADEYEYEYGGKRFTTDAKGDLVEICD